MRPGFRFGWAVPLAALALLAVPSGAGASAIAAAPTPAHWWQAEGNAKDSISHGADNGRLVGGTGFGPGVLGADQAFSFAGGGQGVVFNKIGGNRGTGDFTFAFYLKTTATRYQALWGKRPSSCDPDGTPLWDFRMSHNHDGHVGLSIFSGTKLYDTGSATPVNDGKWHLIAATRHRGTVKFYIDGNLGGTITIPATVNLVNDAPMLAGVNPCDGVDGTNPFTGELDELMIFRTAFTQSQIQALGRR